ncbi:MAG: sulfite exporter TauE/SafE family protein [Desulfopila sp.]
MAITHLQELLGSSTLYQWLGILLSILFMGMAKGGLPVSQITLPIMVLVWPNQHEAARASVSFMLPLLCLMDIFAAVMYKGKPNWHHLRLLAPGVVAGVVVASVFFVADGRFSVSDQTLKGFIGLMGILFSLQYFWLQHRQHQPSDNPRGLRAIIYGFLGGITSTAAHAGGSVMQAYLLGTNLPKERFAATMVYFFLLINLFKLIPFTILGRFNSQQLLAELWMIPLLPIGVLLGFWLVRRMPERAYRQFTNWTLLGASIVLVYQALR